MGAEEELRRTIDSHLDRLRSAEAPEVDAEVARLRVETGQPF